MRKNRKNIRSLQILGLCLILLAVGGYLIMHLPDNTKEGAEPDAQVTVDELTGALSFGVYENEDWDIFFGTFHQEYLTGEMLRQMAEYLGVAEYISLPEYADSRTVCRADWNFVYEQLLDLLDMERSVMLERLLVLDVMEGEESGVLITNQGDYYTSLPLSYFEVWEGYELYCLGDRCLSLSGMLVEELWIENVYLRQCEQGMIDFLFAGASYQKEIGELESDVNPGVCDLVFASGSILSLRMKEDIIEGQMLSYDGDTIEIEGYGRIAHTGRLPVYQVYGEVTERSLSDVVIGNMEVAYVTGEGQVCTILIRQPADIRNIRVLLLAEDGTNFRDAVYLTCNVGATVICGEYEETVEPGSVVAASEFLSNQPESTLVLTPASDEGETILCNAEGETLSNGYRGNMEVRSYAAGYTVVNQLPLETYLWAVVPSEMPSSYEPEALKAQAVCARSYAYIQLLRADLAGYGAHINDSTSYQVYNRVAATGASKTAVETTAGQILVCQGNPIEAYYFSTSMGYTDTAEVWNVDDAAAYPYLKSVCLNTEDYDGDLSTEDGFLSYIQETTEGYDSNIRFYRWKVQADYHDREDVINSILNRRRASSAKNVILCEKDGVTELVEADDSTLGGFGALKGISVAERSSAGAILALKLQYENGTVFIKTEYNIRMILGACADHITYADGTENGEITMLPSAFCAVVPNEDGTVTLYGGGYGHGIGMSQNGANGMAKIGMTYEEILQYFYNDIMISTI